MSDTATQITDDSAFKVGSLGKQILFFVITFGIYGIYWMHKLHKSIESGTDADASATIRTIGMFVPIYNLVVLWRDSHDVEAITEKDGVLTFLLFLVIAPVGWYLIQNGINEMHGE